MRTKLLGVLIAALALGVVAVPGMASATTPTEEESAANPLEVEPLAEESCQSGHVCVWPKENYQGARGESLCTGGVHTLTGLKLSAKNRCANKASWLRRNAFTVECMNPGDSFPGTFEFNELWIGAEGSRC